MERENYINKTNYPESLTHFYLEECPYLKVVSLEQTKLEQLERLRSEDTPRRLMITHTIESCWIPSQN